jgi:hypothetical protein
MREVKVRGVWLFVQADYCPNQTGGSSDPSWPAYYDINNVEYQDKFDDLINVTKFLSDLDDTIFGEISEALLKQDEECY